MRETARNIARREQVAYDLTQLFAFREALETLSLAPLPTAQVLYSHTTTPLRRVGILCGSFNPLTVAHTELAEQANEVFQLDQVFFTLATVTVDKERVTGMGLEDRLLLLSAYARQHDRIGVALVNRGLYFEQAHAFRLLFGVQVGLNFVIGMDKLFQILDPSYYQNRETALQQLFSQASFLIANRGEMDQTAFRELLERPENRPYRAHMHFFRLPTAVTELSATAIRQAIATGKTVDYQVPEETAAFLAETRAYHPPVQKGDESIDAYASRLQLIELFWAERSWATQEADFPRLMRVALLPNEQGRALRHCSEATDPLALLRSAQESSS